jgi:thiol-disulfide isomerase/thioredoxin
MKKITILLITFTITLSTFASQPIALDKEMFIEKVFDFEYNPNEWRYRGDRPAIINFWAPWCAPCRVLSHTLTRIAREFGDSIYVYKINIDEQPELAALFGVSAIPFSLFVPMEGMPYAAAGALSRAALRRGVNEILLNRE